MQMLNQAAVPVLADGAGYHHATEWGWVMMAGWWIIVVIVVVVVLRALPSTSGKQSTQTIDAESILAQRFATGEIDADEYNERRSTLRS